MTQETNGSPATLTIPRRWIIVAAAGGVVALLVITVLATVALMQGQPSETDLLVRAMAGDEEAAEVLAARSATRTSISNSPEGYGFTEGIYWKANPDATDAGEIAASLVILATEGRIEEATKFVSLTSGSRAEILAFIDFLSRYSELQARIEADGVLVVNDLGGTLVSVAGYMARHLSLTLTAEGSWVISDITN